MSEEEKTAAQHTDADGDVCVKRREGMKHYIARRNVFIEVYVQATRARWVGGLCIAVTEQVWVRIGITEI
jgi:hypothetical protein